MPNQRVLIPTALTVLLTGMLAFGSGQFYKSSQSQKSEYSTDMNELRAKFNADKGKIRLLMLLSPS
jgi:hypothetical protein